MSLSNEAAYLYVYSKELIDLNKKLKKLSKKAEKFTKKYHKESNEEKKIKWQLKHTKLRDEIVKLHKEHNVFLKLLRRHQIAFAHQLTKEHKI